MDKMDKIEPIGTERADTDKYAKNVGTRIFYPLSEFNQIRAMPQCPQRRIAFNEFRARLLRLQEGIAALHVHLVNFLMKNPDMSFLEIHKIVQVAQKK